MANRIDIRSVAARALQSADALVREWLPEGHPEGHEWKALNPTRSDSSTGSFSINLNTGAWGDFATGDQGGDLVSLYAYLNSCNNLEAAKALSKVLGITTESPREQAPPTDKKRTEWQPLAKVPGDAPAPPDRHPMRGLPDASWKYETLAGELIGLIYRFRTSDGGKEILPCVYAEHSRTKVRDWRWMAFTAPRPLYGLPRLGARPVLLVEGEKCADAAYAALGGDESPLAVLTWPGGSKATSKADFSPLAGRQVLLWPDCDAQTDRDGSTLPEPRQPGTAAMEAIAERLRELSPPAKVKIVCIPPPGGKPAGWDVADAIAEGATRDQLLELLKRQRAPSRGPVDQAAEAIERIQAGDPAALWQHAKDHLLIWQGKTLKDCRENVIYVVRDHPEWRAVFGADTFAKRIVARKASPLGHRIGDEWQPHDGMRLGLWMTERIGLQVRSLDVIADAVAFVAGENQFHPVREFLNPLAGDRPELLDSWAHKYLGAPQCEYTRLVGRFFLINLVRRVYEPGCVMRSVMVLEGQQDKGKSTALRVLAQPWFSDTPFSLAHKDVYQLIQGVLIYEISELESFTRAEASAVKAFVSSVEDNFRAPYERQNERHKRQTVFAATTNAIEYLKDWTGNTRFWPLATGDLDLDGLARERDALLGAARAAYIDRARAYPTRQEQDELFKPEQDRRMMSHPWMDIVSEWCDGEGKWIEEITTKQVMHDVLRIDLARINPQGGEAQRVGQILHALGYTKRRASGDARGWRWLRPKAEPSTGNDDDIPF